MEPPQTEVAEILAAFGLGAPEYVNPLGGTATRKYEARTGGRRLVVRARPREFEGEALTRFDHEALRRLQAAGLPVPRPLRRPDGESWARAGGRVFEVLTWAEGDAFDPEDRAALASLGGFLARFHEALSRDTPRGKDGWLREDHPAKLADYPARLSLLASGREETKCVETITAGLERTGRELDSGLYARLPQAVIHGDVHPGNLRFRHSEVSAVYDFDYMSNQARARDVADALMFFAARRPAELRPEDIWSLTQPFTCDLDRSRELLAAYCRVIPLTDLEWATLPLLMRSRWIQVRLRGSRKVPDRHRVRFVLTGLAEPLAWLDGEAGTFLRTLRDELKT